MPRPVFWPTNDSYTLAVGGFPHAGIPVRIWTQQTGGVQVADLTFVLPDGSIGAAVPAGVLVSDGNGLLPSFAGPDNGPTTLWGDHGLSGERIALTSGPGSGGGGGVSFGTIAGTAAEGNDPRIVGALSGSAAGAVFARKAATWATGVAYVVGELVVSSGTLYRVTTAHTSGVSVDLGNFAAIGGGGGGGGGAVVTIDSDGTLVVDGTTVELGTDAEIAAAIAAAAATKLTTASNLSDIPNAATARTNLGLGTAAVRGVGTSSGTVAAGDDPRIVGALTTTAANATYARKWQPSIAFVSGDVVDTPDGSTATAISTHTSGASYDPALWSQRPAGVPLARWRRRLHLAPADAKVAFPGDSTSDVTTGSYALYQRLYGLHTQAGEALAGLASTDLFADFATTSGSPTVTSATAAFVSTDVGKMIVSANIPVGARINSVESGTSVTISSNATATGTGQAAYLGRHIIGGGNNGLTLALWLSNPAATTGYNYNQLVADAPDLIVLSFGINDVRLGATSFSGLRALLVTAIERLRADLPNADVLLRMPNTLLSANVSSLNLVQNSGGTINPTGLAQTYSTLLRDVYLSLQGVWSHVAVADVQGNVFGTQSTASSPLMADQLHPSPRTSAIGTGATATPRDGGFVAIADYLAGVIGNKRGSSPDGPLTSRYRAEFLVLGAAGAGGLDLVSKFPLGPNAAQEPITTSDTLYVPGYGALALTGTSITRPFGGTNIRITGLTGNDFSTAIGRNAVVTGSHPPATTGDRQQVSLDLPSIAAGAVVTATVAVTGARTGASPDATCVLCTPAAGFVAAGLVLQGCYVSATDTVTVVVYNPTGGAVDLAASTFSFWVVR